MKVTSTGWTTEAFNVEARTEDGHVVVAEVVLAWRSGEHPELVRCYVHGFVARGGGAPVALPPERVNLQRLAFSPEGALPEDPARIVEKLVEGYIRQRRPAIDAATRSG